MRNEEKSRNYSEEGKSAVGGAIEKLKNNKHAKIGLIALVVFVGFSVLAHFYA